jgi:GT2 family glycosyltransferase
MQLFQRHFRFQPNVPRWKPSIQYQRRSILAKSRNYLLHRALDDEEWVLWLDVDVCQYPPDVIERLMEVGKEIIVPHCILQPEGTSYDLNTFRFKPGWQDRHCPSDMIDGILQPPKGRGRLYLEDLRDYDIVRVDAVGGTMLLVKADLHREGLCFPSFSYDYYIETEGFAMMARDMGYTCWGLPHVYIVHAS